MGTQESILQKAIYWTGMLVVNWDHEQYTKNTE